MTSTKDRDITKRRTGELPKNWSWARLSDLGELGRGKSKHRPRNDPSLFGGAYPFIQTGDVAGSDGRIRSHSDTYNERGLEQSKLWPAGTVCITIAANIADTGILEYPACFPDSVVGLVADQRICIPEYVEQFIRTVRTQLADYAPSTAQKNINLAILNDLEVPLPPLPEQKRIVAILDKADAIRRKRKEAIALTEELLRSAFLEMFGDPVTNPKGWEVKPLGDIGTITDGTHKTPTYVDSGIPFLSAKNVRAHRIDWCRIKHIPEVEHGELVRRCKPMRGDVLLTKSGTIGESAVVDRDTEFSLFESVALIKADHSILDPVLLASALNHPSVRRLYGADVKGVGVKHLHLIDIRRLPTLIPPRALQNRYVTFAKRANALLLRDERTHEHADALFHSLVRRAFTGEDVAR